MIKNELKAESTGLYKRLAVDLCYVIVYDTNSLPGGAQSAESTLNPVTESSILTLLIAAAAGILFYLRR
jgi:hypothetical protein